MLQTLFILTVIIIGGTLVGLIQVQRFGGGSKRNMVLTGLIFYAMISAIFFIEGESPVWLVLIFSLLLIPTGIVTSWIIQKINSFVRQMKGRK